MSAEPDPLEAELAALRPQEVSPGFRERITQRLAAASPATSGSRLDARRRWWWLAGAGALAAAGLAVLLLWWAAGEREKPKPVAVQPRPMPPAPVPDAEPTLRDYRRALAHSPEDLEALLRQRAAGAPKPNPEPVPLAAFTRSEAALHTFFGDD
jgi:hypothetical protein